MSVEKNILFYDINYIFVAKGTFWNIKKWYILKEFKVFYIAYTLFWVFKCILLHIFSQNVLIVIIGITILNMSTPCIEEGNDNK